VSILNTRTNICETIRITGRFEREKNKNCITDLENNWLEQEEIPLKIPTKQRTSYDGSDVHYNSYCRVKKLYEGYGCGQPNEKIEIERKENTNYPAFLTKNDMSILATLTKVFLLHGDTTVSDLTVSDFYYDSSLNTGYGFRFAPNYTIPSRSPYIQNISVITQEVAGNTSPTPITMVVLLQLP
jgi:hypothetical protein